jgi:S1-C subfamily serine protease
MLHPDNNPRDDEKFSYPTRRPYDDPQYYPSADQSASDARLRTVRGEPTSSYQTLPPSPQPGMFQPGPTAYNSTAYPPPSVSVSRPAYGNFPPETPPGKRPRSGGGWRAGAITALTLVIAAVFGVGLFAGWQFGRTSSSGTPYAAAQLQQPTSQSHVAIPALSGNNTEAVREAVVANVRPAVVQINVATAQGTALGSGVIIDKRGYIVTNNHVVAGARNGTVDEVVLSDGTRVTNAQIVGVDSADDLAVVKINPPANMVVAPIADSSQLRVGQDVMAIGNPLGNTQTVTSGIISALGRNVCEQQTNNQGGCTGAIIPNAVQTDAPINPGNSGGALVDLNGRLVGIPTLTAIDPEFNAPASGVGFAIPSNRVQFIVPQIIQNGKVSHTGRAAMGIYPTAVDQMTQAQDNLSVDHGVLVTQVVNNGAAAKAGIQGGDVIVQINNSAIDSIPALEDALISKNPGDKVTVKAYRANQQLTFTVTLSELAAGQN